MPSLMGRGKQPPLAAAAEKLAGMGVAGEDVFVGYVENPVGDWPLGFAEPIAHR